MTPTLHINRTLIGALSDRPDPSREVILWIDKDTGLQSVADGTQWVNVGGGGAASGVELAYAQITSRYSLPNAPITAVPGLSVTFTPAVGTKYTLEFYAAGLDEDSGSTAGSLVTAVIDMDGNATLQTANVWQAVGGVGSAVFMKTPTQIGDGNPHTFHVLVNNVTNASEGVILEADGQFPAFLRAVSL